MMKVKKLIQLDCTEAAEFCDKTEYKETGFFGKIKLKLHLHFCENCRNYQKKNKKLSLLLNKAQLHTCTRAEKEAFKLQLNQESSKDPLGQ